MATRTRPRRNPDTEVPPTEVNPYANTNLNTYPNTQIPTTERIPDMEDNKTTYVGTFPLDKPNVEWKPGTYGPRPDWIYTPGVFNPNERSVWDFLNMRAGKDRKAFSSQEDIADHIGVSVRTVKRTTADLKARGFLTWEKIKTSGTQKYPTNSYTLHVPAEFVEHLGDKYLAKPADKKTQTAAVPAQRGSQKSSQPKEDLLDVAMRVGTRDAFLEAFPGRPDTAELYFAQWQQENGLAESATSA